MKYFISLIIITFYLIIHSTTSFTHEGATGIIKERMDKFQE